MNRIPVIILNDTIGIDGAVLTHFPRKGDIMYIGESYNNDGYWFTCYDKNNVRQRYGMFISSFITLTEHRNNQIDSILI